MEEIEAAALRFLEAFDHLDWPRFSACWAAEPTVFFPFADTPERVTGRAAVEARFRRFFDEARQRSPGPRYLRLEPQAVRVERHGETGLVTFTLPPRGRRTLVFIREESAWKLVHLHASLALA